EALPHGTEGIVDAAPDAVAAAPRERDAETAAPAGTAQPEAIAAESVQAVAVPQEDTPIESAGGEIAPTEPATAEPVEEPKPILLWRIGRFDRPRHHQD